MRSRFARVLLAAALAAGLQLRSSRADALSEVVTPPLAFVPSVATRFSCLFGNTSEKTIEASIDVLNFDGSVVALPTPYTLGPLESRFTTEGLPFCTKPPCMCRLRSKAASRYLRLTACLNDTGNITVDGVNCTVAIPGQ